MTTLRTSLAWLLPRALVSIFGLAFALGAAEVALRLVDTETKPRPIWDRPPVYYMPDDMLDLRDRKPALPKPAHTLRIAVAGDSFTFGPSMQYDDTFSKRLERLLNLNQIQE